MTDRELKIAEALEKISRKLSGIENGVAFLILMGFLIALAGCNGCFK